MKYTNPPYSCDYLNFFIEQRINPINQKTKDYDRKNNIINRKFVYQMLKEENAEKDLKLLQAVQDIQDENHKIILDERENNRVSRKNKR